MNYNDIDEDDDSAKNVDGNKEIDSSDTEDDTVEIEKQGVVVNKILDLPEKHFVFAKLMRTYIKKKILLPKVTAKGCLVDKLNGVIHCCAVANVWSSEERETIQVSFICYNGMLSGSNLCKQLQEVFANDCTKLVFIVLNYACMYIIFVLLEIVRLFTLKL